MTLSAETPLGRLRPVGMDWLLRGQQRTPEIALAELLAVTPDQVNEVLHTLPFERATIVALGPLKELV